VIERIFVVVRFDSELHPPDEALRFTVVEAFPDESSAVAEADRLNDLNGHKGQQYRVQSARWYPSGRDVTAP
jgi:hypothetical protein